MADLLYKGEVFAFIGAAMEVYAEDHLTSGDEAQLINQLKATCTELGLLVNLDQIRSLIGDVEQIQKTANPR
jgi:hypothetical protein